MLGAPLTRARGPCIGKRDIIKSTGVRNVRARNTVNIAEAMAK